MAVSLAVIKQCLVQASTDKRQALAALDHFYVLMANDINTNYDQYRNGSPYNGRSS